jgi:hypothetical protein
VDHGMLHYEQKHQQQKLQYITKQAAQHGFALVPLAIPL